MSYVKASSTCSSENTPILANEAGKKVDKVQA